jgi:hypothetical protein
VKTNLVHTLHRVQKYGLLPLQKFVEMLRPSELKKCMVPSTRKTWYSMPADVFTAFMFRVSYLILYIFFGGKWF